MKSDQRSTNVHATDQTNDETLDDERVQTRSREAYIVVTSTVTGKLIARILIEVKDDPSINQTLSRTWMVEEKQSRNQSDKIASAGEERSVQQHELDLYIQRRLRQCLRFRGCSR